QCANTHDQCANTHALEESSYNIYNTNTNGNNNSNNNTKTTDIKPSDSNTHSLFQLDSCYSKRDFSTRKGESDKKERRFISNSDLLSCFENFWQEYPRKQQKQEAKKVYMNLFKSIFLFEKQKELFYKIKKSVAEHKRMKQWTNEQYIPLAVNFLRKKMYDDEIKIKSYSVDVLDKVKDKLEKVL
ncbi:MAG: hypothetical protein LBD41_01950, partial [Clostridiales Family XIII bacterium]|nr:hypothetical protein [Clostridiales Family XIII bacterium]